ncbi:DUF4374 domain-containing protein [uncultured Apibacter sp.]|uniref:DUF4374 domain-containing protein n=1 Tax=uncultured Apibacter sp. TaxID=1778616 RepID=UPI0025E04F31|nr:DUF4374 domain-containing protein [uncultured Apibacter sp.]
MKKTNVFQRVFLSFLAGYMTLSCSSDDDNNNAKTIGPTKTGKFVVAASPGSGKLGTGTYFLALDHLDSGKDSVSGNLNSVKTTSSFTQIVVNNSNNLVGFIYPNGSDLGQGKSGSRAFKLSGDNKIEELKGSPFITGRFSVTGNFGKYIYAISNNDNSYIYERNGDNMTLVDKPIDLASHMIEDKKPSITGIADRGNNEIAVTFKYTNSDNVFVAFMDYNFTIKTVIQDTRISFSGGQWRGAIYSQIWPDQSGNIYVFSGAGSGNKTTKKAGALKINKGAITFDSDYFFDIETAAGGYKFRKVFPITQDYYLIEFYNETSDSGNTSSATRFAVVKMENKKFKWIDGIPDYIQISSNGWPLAHKGKIYLPLNLVSGNSAIYEIDPVTGIAKKGFELASDKEHIRAVTYFEN